MAYKSELQSNNTDLQSILDIVNELPEEIQLPELTNPATAEIIPAGYEAVDGNGVLLAGTGAGLGSALVENVDNGVTFTSENGLCLTGTSTKSQIKTGSVNKASSTSITISGLSSFSNAMLCSTSRSTDTRPIFHIIKNGSSCKVYAGIVNGSSIDSVISNDATVSGDTISTYASYGYMASTYSYILWN